MAPASLFWIVCMSVITSRGYARQSSRFVYTKMPSTFFRGAIEECNLCFERECYTMDQARCEYYTTAPQLVSDDFPEEVEVDQSSEVIRRDIDTVMIDLVEQAKSPVYQECIPFISEYTDCTKENECLGCTECSCDEQGSWNCSLVQHCLPQPPINVDQRILDIMMEDLNNDVTSSIRYKRSVLSDRQATSQFKIPYEDLSEWMYGVKSIQQQNNKQTNTQSSEGDINISKNKISDSMNETGTLNPIYSDTTKVETDYLVFDDVLNNYGLDSKIYNRRKPLNNLRDGANNYLSSDEVNNNLKNEFFNIMDLIGDENDKTVTEVTHSSTTKVVIDLLMESGKEAATGMNKTTAFKDIFDNKESDITNSTFENSHDLDEFNVMNIRKRDVAEANTDNSSNVIISTQNITTETINDSNTEQEHSLNMYTVLNKIILNKQKELKELLLLKKQLDCIKSENKSLYISTSKTTQVNRGFPNVSVSFYNIKILSNSNIDFKRNNMAYIDKQLERLKHDIIVLIRDIVVIQRLVGKKNIPSELKKLKRAMKYYVHKTEQTPMFENKDTLNNSFRRQWTQPYPIDNNSVNRYLKEIFLILDKNMPRPNALSPLSPKCKTIIKRIISNHIRYPADLKDPTFYESEDYLKNVGINSEITKVMSDTDPESKLFRLKLLHFALQSNVERLTGTVASNNFMPSRRLASLKDGISEKELKIINTNLKAIHAKINQILELRALPRTKSESSHKDVKTNTETKSNNKESLLKHIRRLLRNSKRDILKLLRKEIPKSEIVRELARKKLDELRKTKLIEYESVMQKWQRNLNVNARNKRSIVHIDDVKTRIKSILPKYLRGKVNSGMKNMTKTKKRTLKLTHGNKKQNKYTKRKHQSTKQ